MGSKAFKPTLRNSKKISSFLNHPEKALSIIHVAGSNGKGSTCSMLSSILTESEFKVGLFTSPHIKDYTERIRINGVEIPKAYVVHFIDRIKAANFDFTPSFFEITFGLALDYFKAEACDICIVETGLGGKFDATNIINPILSVITNISLEHTAMLGNTIALIAGEKAGIIKAQTPVVLGEMDIKAERIMVSTAHNLESKIIQSKPFSSTSTSFNLPLLGKYQLENLTTVLACLEELNQLHFKSTNTCIQKGLDNINQNTGFSGRMQLISLKPRLIYDVSHNPAGISASLKTLNEINNGKLHVIFGTSADKDLMNSLPLFPLSTRMYFTEFTNNRSLKIATFRQASETLNFEEKSYFTNPKQALKAATKQSSNTDTILIIGSFFLISDFL
ncbi:MAG: bifunctional folylpolyglutamate synthase/dihydrofolate synthase [Crocinitomicaceae bacterium]|nr:bifunctional folylpolyglutamate synthase/dihydrofolate synthase [Crocinitomicaceae bacterium]